MNGRALLRSWIEPSTWNTPPPTVGKWKTYFSEEILLDVKKTVGEFCDASAACLAPEKVEACVIVKSNLALSRDTGIGNKWEINVWLIDWFLLASLTKWLILVYVEYWLLKNQKLKNWTSQNKLLWSMKGMKSLRIQSFKGSWKSRKITGSRRSLELKSKKMS